MLKRNIISVVALGVFAVFAAGSTPDIIEQIQSVASTASSVEFEEEPSAPDASGGGSAGNHAACVAYVEKYNSLPCIQTVGANIPVDDTCPEALDQTPIDMTPYYRCLEEAAKCNGDYPDLTGVADCSM